MIIYRYNFKLTFLLLHKNVIYYVKDYNINLKKNLSKIKSEKQDKNFWSLKKDDLIVFWLF